MCVHFVRLRGSWESCGQADIQLKIENIIFFDTNIIFTFDKRGFYELFKNVKSI